MDVPVLLTSAVVAAIVGGLITYVGQQRLAERQAQIDYESNARRRLYEAIGPLRLQLLFAARDLARRVGSHIESKAWDMNPRGYYAKSFIYRFLRPLAIGTLIEQQMSFADFTVDSQALDLLRFNATAYRMLTGGEAILDHPDADWSSQSQHLFSDNLRAAAATLIVKEAEAGSVVVDFARFSEAVGDPLKHAAIGHLAALFGQCRYSLCENPILWARVVGYGYACKDLLESHDERLGFVAPRFPVTEMLQCTEDRFFLERLTDYPKAYEDLLAEGL